MCICLAREKSASKFVRGGVLSLREKNRNIGFELRAKEACLVCARKIGFEIRPRGCLVSAREKSKNRLRTSCERGVIFAREESASKFVGGECVSYSLREKNRHRNSSEGGVLSLRERNRLRNSSEGGVCVLSLHEKNRLPNSSGGCVLSVVLRVIRDSVVDRTTIGCTIIFW